MLPLLVAMLASCGGNSSPTAVAMFKGTMIGMSEKIAGNSHLTSVDASKVNTLLKDKESFILLVKDTSDGCICWTSFHDDVLAPYIVRKNLLVYLISLEDFKGVAGYASLGLTTYTGAVSMGIFENGALKYQGDTADLSSPWTNNPTFFASWMDARVKAPKIFYVDENQLESLYQGNEAFTIYFGRDKCGDCGYFDEYNLKPYLFAHDNLDSRFYYFDADIWRDNLASDDYGKKKEEFGLCFDAANNPAGYGTGAFPTLYRIHPDGEGTKTGDVIELGAVFYNEMLTSEMKVEGSYFTSERLASALLGEIDYLEYARAAGMTNVIEGLTLSIPGYEEMSRLEKSKAKKDALSVYETPLANAFLQQAIGNP